MFQNKNAVSNLQTAHIHANMSCCFVLLMMNNEYFVNIFDLWCLNHTCKLTFQPGKFWWHFLFIYYLRIKPVITCLLYVMAIILLFVSATLWQRVNLNIHFTFYANSVVNFNWHINKKKKQVEHG